MAEPVEVQTAVPVLATKLRRPSTPLLLVGRPRLLDRLKGFGDRRLTLVSAPAGYGKTALVSEWLGSAGSPYAWLSLDEHDNDPATFLLYLVASTRCAYPDSLDAVEQLLRAPTLLPPVKLADAVLQGFAALPGPSILAFDDYHVIRSPEIHALMSRVVEYLPPHVHLVLITRSDPPLPLERLRGRQQLGETRAADLRFTTEEAGLLLQRMLGPDVSQETVALLEDSTEGWAVGLHLAGLSLRTRMAADRSDAAVVARKIAEHGHHAVTEYLLSEVLACLPSDQADCLLQTSLFDRMCASLIDAAQAQDDAKLSGSAFVRIIRSENLFVVSLDDEGVWFRYHHYFRSLLRARLGQRYSDAEIKAIHARAAAWFCSQGLVDETIAHFLKAGDPASAAELVEEQVHPALDRENWRRLEQWMNLLPPTLCAQRPALLLAQALLHYIRWQHGAIAVRVDAAEVLMRDMPFAARGAEANLRGQIGALRSALAANNGDGKLLVQLSEAAIAALSGQTGYVAGLACFNYIWGLQVCGEYQKAVEFAHRQLDASAWQPNALNLRVLLALANIHHEMADLLPVLDLLPPWQKLARESGAGLSVSWSQYSEGWVRYQRNELEAAAEAFCRFAGAAAVAHGRAVVDGYTGLVLTALAQGRPGEASGYVQALNERLLERGMLALVSVAQSLGQRVALAVGSPSALEWRPDASSSAVPVDIWEQPMLTYVRTLLAVGSPDALARASELLAAARVKALARNSQRRLIELGAFEALVLSAQGDEPAALTALRGAVERAGPGGALRLLADAGPGLIPLLRRVQDAGVAARFIENVLAASAQPVMDVRAEPATAAPESAASAMADEAPADTLTNRQIDILILLADRLSDKEIAERLVLSPVTVKKHTQRIYRKLGVENRRAAVAQARRLGLI